MFTFEPSRVIETIKYDYFFFFIPTFVITGPGLYTAVYNHGITWYYFVYLTNKLLMHSSRTNQNRIKIISIYQTPVSKHHFLSIKYVS